MKNVEIKRSSTNLKYKFMNESQTLDWNLFFADSHDDVLRGLGSGSCWNHFFLSLLFRYRFDHWQIWSELKKLGNTSLSNISSNVILPNLYFERNLKQLTQVTFCCCIEALINRDILECFILSYNVQPNSRKRKTSVIKRVHLLSITNGHKNEWSELHLVL